MLQPARVKYRKPHRTKYEGKAKGNKYVVFGEYGLKATTGNWVKAKQIEAARIVLSHFIDNEKRGKMWIRIFPQLSLTKKPLEVRMGSGKGNPEEWVAVVKAGTIMFELGQMAPEVMKKALKQAGNKLNVLCKVVKKGEEGNE